MQTNTLPQTGGFPRFKPGDDRPLIASVHRWARQNGWAWSPAWGWVNARYASEATVNVDWEDGVLIIRSRPNLDVSALRATEYEVDTVRRAVDLLVLLGHLPPHLSSQYRAGYQLGYRYGSADAADGAS